MSRRRTREPATCDYCGAFIRWAKTAKKGAWMPFDIKPVSDADYFLVNGVAYTGTDNFFRDNPDVERYRPHWATCPRANEARRKRK